jgi:hypothetical protein
MTYGFNRDHEANYFSSVRGYLELCKTTLSHCIILLFRADTCSYWSKVVAWAWFGYVRKDSHRGESAQKVGFETPNVNPKLDLLSHRKPEFESIANCCDWPKSCLIWHANLTTLVSVLNNIPLQQYIGQHLCPTGNTPFLSPDFLNVYRLYNEG